MKIILLLYFFVLFSYINTKEESYLNIKSVLLYKPWLKQNHLTWCFLNSPLLPVENFFNILTNVQQAIEEWTKLNVFEFEYINCINNKSNIIIQFCNLNFYSINEIYQILARTFYLPNQQVKICINNQIQWEYEFNNTTVFSSKFIFYSMILHELGHVLGLGHNTNINSLMYSKYHNVTSITDIDKDVFFKLYNQRINFDSIYNIDKKNVSVYFYFKNMLLHHPYVIKNKKKNFILI